jgi:hypothetical protein
MASLENRSRYVVSIKNRNDLTKEFPYSDARRAREYFNQLRGDGLKPKITRLSDHLLVRIENLRIEGAEHRFDSRCRRVAKGRIAHEVTAQRIEGLQCSHKSVPTGSRFRPGQVGSPWR